MGRKMNRIGILGGTFDPVHYGHLIPAQQVANECGLDCVLFIPTGNPNFKQGEVCASRHDRAEMLRIAIEDFGCSSFKLDCREIKREGVTYSVDTFEELMSEFPKSELCFIVGSDCATHIMSWKNASRLSELCTLIVTQRCNYSFDDVAASQAKSLKERHFCFECEYVHTKQLPISSTEIRERLKVGKSINDLTLPRVAEYINENKLYRND